MKKAVDYIGVGCGALIVNEKNQVLLMHRTGKSQGGMKDLWSQPGGALEFGEDPADAIKRELKEELDVDVELFGDLRYFNHVMAEEGITKHWAIVWCFAKIVSGTVRNTEPEKHDRVGWFDIDKLPDDVVEFTVHSIEEYKKRIKIFR